MENTKNTGYILHDFMKEDLGLSGVALRVYALIYSFTKSGGDCFGSVDYIAERVGASRSSVKYAIKNLLANGYIEKIEDTSIKTNRYVAKDMDVVNEKCPTGQKLTGQKLTPTGQKLTPDRSEIDPNNKENNKTHNNTTNNHSFTLYRAGKPVVPIGDKKVVMMTLHEYANLLKTVGVLPTLKYLHKLERRILSHPVGSFKNHYNTIVSWARHDGYVVPAEQ